jgi:hypothetical protein
MSTENEPPTTETDCSSGWIDEYDRLDCPTSIEPENIIQSDESDPHTRKHELGVSS